MSDVTKAEIFKPEPEDSKTVFGFWVYLMTDCVLFASLFAVYAVLHGNVFGGPSGRDIFDLPYVMGETLLLLTSSFTVGLAIIAAGQRKQRQVLALLAVTFLLGASFVFMEVREFHHLVSIGDSWRRSGFLSSYFTLVATHGLHITVGLLWMGVMMFKVLRGGLTTHSVKRLTLLSMFWHFLDVVWIFIFTIVYLMGALPS
ncbi:MAG TPA: cytochrome o ubiquinol oxidase subunit III [Candidatus Saccharimonadales bacterium]